MSFFSWLRQQASARDPRGGARRRPETPRFRPRLEQLEDRLTPATTVVGGFPLAAVASPVQFSFNAAAGSFVLQPPSAQAPQVEFPPNPIAPQVYQAPPYRIALNVYSSTGAQAPPNPIAPGGLLLLSAADLLGPAG